MTDDNGQIAGSIGTDENITHAPEAVGPNIEFAITPVGLIRVAFSTGVVMSAFYCDATAARIVSAQFAEVADKLDAAHEQLRALNEFTVADTVEEDDTIQEAEVIEAVVEMVPDELVEDDNSLNGR